MKRSITGAQTNFSEYGSVTRLKNPMVAKSTFAVVIGTVVGVPLGIALGRQLWILFARSIDAVPQPTVPLLSVILVALGALVLANLVAALPGRSAAGTPAAAVLRTS